MPKYKICYAFDGYGEVWIEAKSKKEAEELLPERKNEDCEWGENTIITSVEKTK